MKFPKNAPMNNKTGFRREFRAGFCRAFVLVANEISSERQVGGSNVGGVPSSRAHNQHLKRLYLAKTICASSDVQATRLCHQPNSGHSTLSPTQSGWITALQISAIRNQIS